MLYIFWAHLFCQENIFKNTFSLSTLYFERHSLSSLSFLHFISSTVFAACLGLLYIYARHKYFWGYAEAAEKRITGFRLSLGILALLTVLAVLGVASRFLNEYLDFHVAKKLRKPF
uniref:Microsomal glutathione S-transferase 2 n=1 Tax=Mus spicilegus TaxID=10103 RepID=A0A8C6H000_MUSSI